MAIEQASNQGKNQSPTAKNHFTELAFLRLGDILAEIADTSDRHWDTERLHEKSENTAGDSQDKGEPT